MALNNKIAIYMNTTGSTKSIIFVLFLLFSVNIVAQSTFKVVCDKADKRVKVVKSDNRSARYVPIKSGFPFKQIAQKWIDENYTTTICNPEELVDQIESKKETSDHSIPVTQDKLATQNNSTKLQARKTGVDSSSEYHNTSLVANVKFSNIGKSFSLEKNMVTGFEVGFEHLFGKKNYLGIGLGMNFYFVDFSSYNLDDPQTFYFAKFPIFIGHRSEYKKILIAYEVGVEYNTELQASDEDIAFLGRIPNSNSYDLLLRVRVGKGKLHFTVGTENWISKIFDENDFDMSAFYLGIKASF